jgi:hypothetical protein
LLVTHVCHKRLFGIERETKKFPSRSHPPTTTVRLVFNMIKALLLSASVTLILFSTGCGLFSKKSEKKKESSAIAADVEESFRRRWVDKRTGELTAQGIAADVARPQAETEFRNRYNFTKAGQK